MLNNKYDFVAIITADHCNPNGNPINGNRPRDTFDGKGEISDVCIKRKIRNRLQDMGEKIFVQSNDRCDDGCKSLKERADNCVALKEVSKGKNTDVDMFASTACSEWFDVRAFGQVFAFKGDPVSCGVRGPVSVHPAFSVEPVEITSMQITKSVNSEDTKGTGKASDTMGMKHRVDFGVYILKGSINCQLAEKTGFSDEDAQKIKIALSSLFENDASSARPEGSLDVAKLFWFKHSSKLGQYSSAKVHNSVKVVKKVEGKTASSIDDFDIIRTDLDGLECEEI